jgi:leucyl/phenylalanyl-tRNA--protein transferase
MIVLQPGKPDLCFPPVEAATPEGLLAVGGDLSPERLLAAYRRGIFPWYNPGQPILWWSPDPRAVLYPEQLKVSRSLRKTLRRGHFRVRFDTRFREVMLACAAPRRQYPGGGTWITDEMVEAYCRLHELGVAHSVEISHDERLVGGLYGVALGGVFFGESMFARTTDASKVALVALARQLQAWGFALIDCQLPSAHLASLGAEEIPRAQFLAELERALQHPGQPGRWPVEIETRALAGQETPA